MKTVSYEFHIVSFDGETQSYSLSKPIIRVGRSTQCDIVLRDDLVSREHCILRHGTSGWLLEDLNSSNGTFVNEQRIKKILLKPQDRIRIGLSELVLVLKENKKAPATSPPFPTTFDPNCFPILTKDGSQCSILLFHCDPERTSPIASTLKASGIKVRALTSSGELYSALRNESFCCIILFSELKECLDVCCGVRSIRPEIPILLSVQDINRPEIFQLIKDFADDIITSEEPLELLVRVRNLIELNHLRSKSLGTDADQTQQTSVGTARAVEQLKRLARYLSPQVVNAVLSAEESIVLKPVRRDVTIVFADLRNYTHFSEISDPEEVIGMLNDFHTTLGEMIFQYNGTVERFAGDAIMVLFGAPEPLEDHALRAVCMTVNARERLRTLKNKWEKLGYELDVAFGIASGYVYVGNIGFEGRMDYAAIGKTTNLAARLCSVAKGGQILIGRKTYYQVEDKIEVEEIPPLEVKGFSKPVQAYNVINLKAHCDFLPKRSSVSCQQ